MLMPDDTGRFVDETAEAVKKDLTHLSKKHIDHMGNATQVLVTHAVALFRILMELTFKISDRVGRYHGPKINNEDDFVNTPEALLAATEEMAELIEKILSFADKKNTYSVQIVRKEGRP